MGIYDREYLRDDERSGRWGGGRSMVVNLIIINVAIWLADALFEGRPREWLELHSDVLQRPWLLFELLTYGFEHSPAIGHILFNMIALWFFGTAIEGVYGRAEFLRIYLAAIVVAGLAWLVIAIANHQNAALVGASGGVMAVVMLYVLHFPRNIIYIWGVLPIPAWALGTLYIVLDVFGFLHPAGSNVANVAHLGGALFAFIYFRTGMRLGSFVPRRLSDLRIPAFGPKLRIHDPDKDVRDLNRQVDAILEKISRQGEASLTKKERKTLEEASRRYQQRRQ
jgi:membrane associated rhomboid family serine protease